MGSSASCVKCLPTYDHKKVSELFPVINDIETLKKYIDYAKKNNHYERIKEKFREDNVIDNNDTLTTGDKPFNIFARLVSGKTTINVDQSLLGEYSERFVVCHNRPVNDAHWDDPDFYGASMAGPDKHGPGHVFITTKNLSYNRFNILPILIENDVNFIGDLLLAAIKYTVNRNWTNAGFYFHCYPHNSVQSLHLHVLNMDKLGPTFDKQVGKNLSVYDVLSVMEVPRNPNYTFG
jgi:hypothetical protein